MAKTPSWRVTEAQLNEELKREVLCQTRLYGRMNWKNYNETEKNS